jgi:PAS domain S-box-containing protein
MELVQAGEASYRDLMEKANSIILRMDTHGIVTFVNEFAERFFLYAKDEILGRSVVGTIVPDTDSGGRELDSMIEQIGQSPELYVSNEKRKYAANRRAGVDRMDKQADFGQNGKDGRDSLYWQRHHRT